MENYTLTNETIDILSDKIEQMFSDAECSKKDAVRARLLLEEALLKYQNRFGSDIDVTFRVYRIFSETRLCIRISSESFDPFSLEENPMAFMIKSVMSGIEGNMPTWKFRNAQNELVFSVKKKARLGGLSKIGASLAASIVLAFAARLIFSQKSLYAFCENYLEPLTGAYAGLFCIMAVLLTFFAISLSIVHIGDMASVGAFGGIILRRLYIMTALTVAFLGLPTLPFFKISGFGNLNVAAKSIYDVLIGFIPTNLVTPFLDFNSIHIIIVGAMFGFSLLVMGQKGETLVKLFDECNLVAVITNTFINKFIFIYVGLKIFTIINMSDFTKLAAAGKMVGAIVAGELILFVFYIFYVSIKSKIPVGQYLKIMLPAFVVCLSSANFGAAFTEVYNSEMNMKVDSDTANICINLGSVVFKPACTIVFIFSSLFMASSYGVKISFVWIITAFLLSIILVASMPNIPGASVSALTLLYAQLGLPAEALSLMIAINAALQFFTVAVDTWCLQGECVCVYLARQKHREKIRLKAEKHSATV